MVRKKVDRKCLPLGDSCHIKPTSNTRFGARKAWNKTPKISNFDNKFRGGKCCSMQKQRNT
ncbi:unnamed protein product [Penicillium roqueforti FM164]|uniref:Genomic scaffold, ProqFM164S03 n=1 Tax=Penicillium roqueforti (strain FM164) TaxID=1365484 RepID=W6QC95_PENRF|nr:unnamed protein product [Penicillium roqueforti FM164]